MARNTVTRLLHLPTVVPAPLLKLTFLVVALLLCLRWITTQSDGWSLENALISRPTVDVESNTIHWDVYKYVQIVTTPVDLCSAVMIWAQIEEYGSRASR